MYIVAFASVGWVEDGDYDYGLWKWCNRTDCVSITLASFSGYFEAARTLSCFVLIGFCSAFVVSFIEDQPLDRNFKQTFYRYASCSLIVFAVVFAIILMATLASGTGDDANFNNPSLGWCFWVCFVACLIAVFSFFCRLRYIGIKHPSSVWACIATNTCCISRRETRKTEPSESGVDAGVESVEVVQREAEIPANGRSQLPPLSILRKNSSDSGLSSNLASRDSAREDGSHWGKAKGRLSSLAVPQNRFWSRRMESDTDEPRHGHAFSSTTSSPSSSDSESSAELAPRVHTPTDKKRVGFSTALNIARYNRPPPAPAPSSTRDPATTDPVPPPPIYEDILGKKVTLAELAPPIISFPVKMRGVELSRATTTSKTTAFLDNVKLMSSAVTKWRKTAHERVVRREKRKKQKKKKEKGESKEEREEGFESRSVRFDSKVTLADETQKSEDKKEKVKKEKKEKKRTNKEGMEFHRGTFDSHADETQEPETKKTKKAEKKQKRKEGLESHRMTFDYDAELAVVIRKTRRKDKTLSRPLTR
nr:hypothetical protein BaRGS_026890 [Batillaria attramentaria]